MADEMVAQPALAVLLDAHAATIEGRALDPVRAAVAVAAALPLVCRALARLLERGA